MGKRTCDYILKVWHFDKCDGNEYNRGYEICHSKAELKKALNKYCCKAKDKNLKVENLTDKDEIIEDLSGCIIHYELSVQPINEKD